MKQSVRLGRVAGIPVGAHWSVIVILAIVADTLAQGILPAVDPRQPAVVYWAAGCVAAVVFLASLLAHELSHAVVARRSGMRVRSITLWMLGGVAELAGDPPGAGADLRVALAGPAASLVAALVFVAAAEAAGQFPGLGVVAAAAGWLAVMNAMLAVFNLLPGAPLDGGRVLRALLWRHYRDRDRAAVAAARCGRYLGAALACLGLAEIVLARSFLSGLWLVLIGFFLTSAAAAEQASAVGQQALRGLLVADVMTPDPPVAPGWLTVAEFAGWLAAARPLPRAFPVLRADGSLAGIVVPASLGRNLAPERARQRLEQAALPVPADYRAAPGDPAAPLASRPPLGGEVAAIVLQGGQVVGMVTTAGLRQAALARRLAGARAPGPPVPHAGT